MCIIVVGWQVHPEYPLVVAANRDEFHARPTAFAEHWPDDPEIMGGRDLLAGGTWLGIHRNGRFAAVTNVREPGQNPGKCSRGQLTAAFLRSTLPPEQFSSAIAAQDYAGFNLLLADRDQLSYCSNRGGQTQSLGPGIYGVSNHLLDTPWPKLVKLRQCFAEALLQLPDTAPSFAALADRSLVDDPDLPDTGVPLHWERRLSAIFVQSPDYGTRASTLVLRDRAGCCRLIERSFDAAGALVQETRLTI